MVGVAGLVYYASVTSEQNIKDQISQQQNLTPGQALNGIKQFINNTMETAKTAQTGLGSK